jgi:ABC-2 type transport system permease protein
MRSLHLAAAFLRRDCAIATSYRLQFLFHMTAGLFLVASFYFISRLVGGAVAEQTLSSYGSDYFSFVLIGVATTGFLQTGLTVFIERLRSGMTEGSLEMMFVTPQGPFLLLALPCLWSFVMEAIKTTILVAFGVLMFDANLRNANAVAASCAIALSLATFSVFGLISAAILVIVKRGDPLNWAFTQLSALVGGAYFPVEVLPGWMRRIAALVPVTYSYEALRKTLLQGASLTEVGGDLLVLALFLVLGSAVAFLCVELAVRKAKRDGTLGGF